MGKDYTLINQELIEKYKSTHNPKIKNEIVLNNIGLAKIIASNYSKGTYIPFDDLFQEACASLYKIVDSYDMSQNIKFSTYASSCLKWYIVRYIYLNKYGVYVPIHLLERVNKYDRLLGYNLTKEQILEKMEMSEDELEVFKETYKIIKQPCLSMDAEINVHDETTYGDFISSSETGEEGYDNVKKEEFLTFLKKFLTEKEYDVVILKYGFYNDPMTYDEISNILNITSGYANTLNQNAIKKLKLSDTIKEYSLS